MLRPTIFLLLRLTGVPFFLREVVQRNKVTILCYHDPSPEIANRHIQLLKRKYSIISLRQYIEWRTGISTKPLPRKAVILTFDDGHRNNYRLRGIIEELNVPVTVFLCSSIVGTRRHYWWTARVVKGEIAALKRLPDEKRLAGLLAAGFDESREYDDRQALSVEEVESLKSIIDFQAHTRLHPILSQCSTDRVVNEIAGSKTELEERFGLNVYALAYPNGDYSDREIEIVRNAGYKCALTLDGGFNVQNTDLLRLHRIPIYDQAGLNELIVKASGFWDLLVRLFGGHEYGHKPTMPAESL